MVDRSAGADPRLVRAYRRLVWIYPPGKRRSEILDTLIECAPPGRRRPTPREIVNVLWHGNRAQFGRPGHRGIVVLALFVSLAAGFVGSAVGNRLGLELVGPLPAGAEISETVFPGLRVWGGGDAAKIVSQSDGEGVEYGYAVSRVEHTAATRDVPAYTAGVRARLEAAGWTVTGVDPPLDLNYVDANSGDRAEGFAARRGMLGLYFTDFYWPGRPSYDGDGGAYYQIWHQPPAWLIWPTWAGAVIAAVFAWFLTAWVSRALEEVPGIGQLAATGAVLAVVGIVPAALMSAPGGENTASETAAPYWQQLVYLGLLPALMSAAAAALLVLGAAVVRGRHHVLRAVRAVTRPQPRATGTLHWNTVAGRAVRVARERRPLTALAVVVVVLLGLGVYNLIPGTCRPSVPAGIQDPPEAALSYESRVFIDPRATDDQRNLAQAAIGRGFGGSYDFNAGTHSAGFTDAFCGHGRVSGSVAATLPWYWTVSLASPGLFQGLAAEVITMPGVVAVQHLPA